MDISRTLSLLSTIYGASLGAETERRLRLLLETWRPRLAAAPGEGGPSSDAATPVRAQAAGPTAGRRSGSGPFDHRDALLIAYGDMLSAPASSSEGIEPVGADAGAHALQRLDGFLDRHGKGTFTCLHILPFFPYSSDDGFSVMDYRQVDPALGDWEDIAALSRNFRLAFDLVLNHASAKSAWFGAFLRGEAPYDRYFLTRPADYDYSGVVRPRTHPLLTAFRKADGSIVHAWTTFSEDQVDLDFSNPDVLLDFVDIMLGYVQRGARILRLDAIAYLWKEDGTPCLHHPKTHAAVKLFRAVADALDLDLVILTETNVPHRENLSYWGDGDEAQMVYNFALPPLVLHAAVSGDAGPLRRWASVLPKPGSGPVFLNFLASHDGVGVTPAAGLVEGDAFAATLRAVEAKGGLVSYKATPTGDVPYELNCSYLDAVAPPGADDATAARALLCAYAVASAIPGLPAVYFHSWIGSRAWPEGVELTGRKRSINREKPTVALVEADLSDPASLRSRVMEGFRSLFSFRASHPAFSPSAPCRVLETGGAVFGVERGGEAGTGRVVCLQNLGPREAFVPGVPEGRDRPLRPWETRWLAYGADGSAVGELSI